MTSIRSRVIAVVIAILVAGGIAGLVSIDRLHRANVAAVARQAVDTAETEFAAMEGAQEEKMRALLDVLSMDEGLERAYRSGDRRALFDAAWPRFEMMRDVHAIDRWYVYTPGPESGVFLRVYQGESALEPSSYGDITDSRPVLLAEERGRPVAGFVMGRSALSMRVASPWVDEGGTRIGLMSLGMVASGFLEVISEHTGDSYAMFFDKGLLDREAWAERRRGENLPDNWDERDAVVLVDTTIGHAELLDSLEIGGVPRRADVLGTVAVDDRTYAMGAFPLRAVDGDSVGLIVALHDITELSDSMRVTQLRLLASILIVAIIGSATIALSLDRLVFRRLEGMIRHLERLSLAALAGNTDSEYFEVGEREDEIGRFERFFATYTRVIANAVRQTLPDVTEPDEKE